MRRGSIVAIVLPWHQRDPVRDGAEAKAHSPRVAGLHRIGGWLTVPTNAGLLEAQHEKPLYSDQKSQLGVWRCRQRNQEEEKRNDVEVG